MKGFDKTVQTSGYIGGLYCFVVLRNKLNYNINFAHKYGEIIRQNVETKKKLANNT